MLLFHDELWMPCRVLKIGEAAVRHVSSDIIIPNKFFVECPDCYLNLCQKLVKWSCDPEHLVTAVTFLHYQVGRECCDEFCLGLEEIEWNVKAGSDPPKELAETIDLTVKGTEPAVLIGGVVTSNAVYGQYQV
jgi:hypothetical protein